MKNYDFDYVLDGRRSQGRFSLNILDYGVFGASKYEANMFLFFIGREVFSWVNTSSEKSTNKEFLFLINCKFSADLLGF